MEEEHQDLFAGGGEMGALMRTIDWSATSTGPVSSWPASLRTTLATLLSNRFATLLWWGADLVHLYNDAYRPILGEKHPASMGAPAREVWSEIWHIVGPMAEGVLAGGRAVLAEDLLLPMNRKGFVEEAFFTFSYSPVRDENGAVGGVLVTVQETTEQVQGHRQLRTLRDLAASAAGTKTAEDAVRRGTDVLATNADDFPFALVLLADGEEGAQLVAHTGVTDEALASLAARAWPFGAAAESGREVVVEGLAIGSAPVVTRAAVLPLARGGSIEPYGYFVVGTSPRRPFDERYRELLRLTADQFVKAIATARVFEEERRRAEALAEIDRAKTTFFSNVSHEFRTPLTLLLGPIEEAVHAHEHALSGEGLDVVHRNARRLLKLVNTLLDFSRVEAGRAQASFSATDLAALTTDLASAFRSAMQRAGLRFEVDCPPLSEPVWIDREMWEQIVLNLLSNALKFTFRGSIAVRLRLADREVQLMVSDTGEGIPADELPRLFERFHRIENTRSRTHEGTGIGLALVRDLVKLHGGEIEVTSKVGAGTTFRVSIPRGHLHLPPERITPRPVTRRDTRTAAYVDEALRWLEPADARAPESDAATPRARILVADDNADMRQYLARLLGEHWTVETVADGESALAAARRTRPDLVLSDVMMPRKDGFELLRDLKADPETSAIPVMLVSARAGEDEAAAALRHGADDYLVKPFSASALVVRVEAQLAAVRARAVLRRHEQAERERLREMFEISPAAMVVVRGHDLVIELANEKVLHVWGKTSAIIGKPLLEALPELRGQGFDVLLRQVLTTGVAQHGKEVRARLDRHGTGELVDAFFDFVYAPLRDPDGNVGAVLVHAFHVTELVEQRRHAEAANRMKDEFLATMSHELRTPLNAILGWSSLLRAGQQTEDARDRALATIERNARAQARLIDDVLDVSRIVSGKLRLDVRTVDVAAFVHAAVDVVRPAAAAKKLELAVRVDKAAGTISGDADRLQQVVWNLLSNAVRFTASGGMVMLDVVRTASAIEIVVADTGAGIAAQHLPHVFERFRQVDSSTTRRHGGLGLGLAIVRHLVELHGGTVGAASAGEGQGATFHVRLPVLAMPAVDGVHDEPPPHSGTTPVGLVAALSLDGVRVLVTDDDEDSREVVASALENAGAKVTTAPSAREALALVAADPPDVLVSDIGMPDEDGYALIRSVRGLPAARGGSVPAIAVTAYARREDARLALDAGYHEHISKPIDPGTMVEAVHRLAQRVDRG